jgi:hypothetical protein
MSGNNTSKAFNRFSTKTAAVLGISHIKRKSATVCNLKPRWWGAPLVQDKKYQGKGNL